MSSCGWRRPRAAPLLPLHTARLKGWALAPGGRNEGARGRPCPWTLSRTLQLGLGHGDFPPVRCGSGDSLGSYLSKVFQVSRFIPLPVTTLGFARLYLRNARWDVCGNCAPSRHEFGGSWCLFHAGSFHSLRAPLASSTSISFLASESRTCGVGFMRERFVGRGLLLETAHIFFKFPLLSASRRHVRPGWFRLWTLDLDRVTDSCVLFVASSVPDRPGACDQGLFRFFFLPDHSGEDSRSMLDRAGGPDVLGEDRAFVHHGQRGP